MSIRMRESRRKKKERKRETIRNRARLTGRREGRRRELVWGSNWSQRSFDRRWKEEVMRSETVQMNRQGRWMQTRTGGDEIKERQEGEGKKTAMEDLSTCGVTFVGAWRHRSAIIWMRTARAASNPQISPALYIAIRAFVFSGCFGFECEGRWKRHSLLRKKQRHNVTNEFYYLTSRWRASVQPTSDCRLWLTSCCYVPHFII